MTIDEQKELERISQETKNMKERMMQLSVEASSLAAEIEALARLIRNHNTDQ